MFSSFSQAKARRASQRTFTSGTATLWQNSGDCLEVVEELDRILS
jgi:hypothetical protein